MTSFFIRKWFCRSFYVHSETIRCQKILPWKVMPGHASDISLMLAKYTCNFCMILPPTKIGKIATFFKKMSQFLHDALFHLSTNFCVNLETLVRKSRPCLNSTPLDPAALMSKFRDVGSKVTVSQKPLWDFTNSIESECTFIYFLFSISPLK